MDKKVSVIVTDSEDRTFLVRCLNSIRRQTYRNHEVILVGENYPEHMMVEYEKAVIVSDFSEAFHNCSGEYIFFCSMTSVMAPNVISSLMELKEDESVCVAANCMIPSGNLYKDFPEAAFSVYGKLFDKQKLYLNLPEVISGGVCPEWKMIQKYLEQYTELETRDNVCIYETNPEAMELKIPDEECSDEKITEWINTVTCLPPDYSQKLVYKWLIADGDVYSEKVVRNVLLTASLLKEEKDLQYSLVKKYVKQWYQYALDNKDEFLFQSTKEYLGDFEETGDYFDIICKECGITSRQYNHMKKDSLKDYLFFYDKLPDEDEDRKSIKELRLALEIKMREIQLMKVQLEQKSAELKALVDCISDIDF